MNDWERVTLPFWASFYLSEKISLEKYSILKVSVNRV